jgi:hypothetical protein
MSWINLSVDGNVTEGNDTSGSVIGGRLSNGLLTDGAVKAGFRKTAFLATSAAFWGEKASTEPLLHKKSRTGAENLIFM